jgi:hypothetical protein
VLQHSELRCTLPSYAAPYTELGCTLLSCAAPSEHLVKAYSQYLLAFSFNTSFKEKYIINEVLSVNHFTGKRSLSLSLLTKKLLLFILV